MSVLKAIRSSYFKYFALRRLPLRPRSAGAAAAGPGAGAARRIVGPVRRRAAPGPPRAPAAPPSRARPGQRRPRSPRPPRGEGEARRTKLRRAGEAARGAVVSRLAL